MPKRWYEVLNVKENASEAEVLEAALKATEFVGDGLPLSLSEAKDAWVNYQESKIKKEQMRMVEALYYRDGQTLIDLSKESGHHERFIDCGSINKAKKKSREIQEANGGLGRGSVQVYK